MKQIKLVGVGDGAVGKTSMFKCYKDGVFPEEYVPTIFDNYSISLIVDNVNVNLQLWDTAGQEEYARTRPITYPNTNVFLICFSLVSPTSLENIETRWINEVKTSVPDAEIILVGLKKDLRDNFNADENKDPNIRPISTEKGLEVAFKIDAREYLECSAKTKENLDAIFEHAVRDVLNPKRNHEAAKKFN